MLSSSTYSAAEDEASVELLSSAELDSAESELLLAFDEASDEEAEDEEPVVSIYCAKRLWKASSLTLILASLSS